MSFAGHGDRDIAGAPKKNAPNAVTALTLPGLPSAGDGFLPSPREETRSPDPLRG